MRATTSDSDKMESILELTEGALRGIRKTAEDPPRVSVLDTISAVTGLDSSNASTVYNRLRGQFPEVGTDCTLFKFPRKGQRQTPVTCAKGAILIVMLLPHKGTAHVRKQAASTLVRFLGGDLTLVDEVG